MEPSTKKTPIVFPKSQNEIDYHLVSRDELDNMDADTMRKRIDELNLRVQHAKKYYRNRYDDRHRRWMQTLAKPMKIEQKLHLSLDALVAVSEDMKLSSRKRY